MMKRRLLIAAVILTAVLALSLFWKTKALPVEVNNANQVEEIVSKEYDIVALKMVEAIFQAQSGSQTIDAITLAKEAKVKLECKRQVDTDAFYYVIKGWGDWRCFIFADADDVVQEVLVASGFHSVAEIQDSVHSIQAAGRELPEWSTTYAKIVLDIDSNYKYYQYILQDGILIVQWPWMPVVHEIEYHYYTDQEWEEERENWMGYTILRIDKM